MRQLVTGLFETYDDARRAQDALLLKGFSVTDIDLPVPGSEAAASGGTGAGGAGLLAGVERFVAGLFGSRSGASDAASDPAAPNADAARAASLRFALQRGAVLIGVRVFDDAHAAAARDTLIQQRALQVDEHAGDWQPGALAAGPASERERSALDELGIGGLADAWRQHAGRPRTAPTVPDEDTLRARYDALSDTEPPAAPAPGPADDAAVTALATDGAEAGAAPPPAVPDEFLEYEDDFRDHHAARHDNDDAPPFERYHEAYRYGAVLAQDVANQDRAWPDIEPEARRGWETMAPGVAPHYPWEQVRDAVRHGWERASAQGGGGA